MIKNEEKIIERCLKNAISSCDAICVTDTGSTDSTCQKVNEIFSSIEIPGKLYHDEWKHFGHNRTNSFNNTVEYCKELGWDLNTTYGLLLDGDMVLKSISFNKENLTDIGYKMIQKNNVIEYYNTRFVKLGHSWKCVGVTHEYWDGGNTGTLTIDQIYIEDIGDGGAKHDKFDRDIRLLSQGLLDEPNNVRYVFYLAQSLKDTGKFRDSIQMYKKRISMGGWFEEVWYSYYMISKCWLYLGDESKFECWANRAFKYRKERAEPMYDLCKYFRDIGQQVKSYHYYLLGVNIPYPKDDMLFIENKIYEKYLFEYELSIIHYYVFTNDRLSGLKKMVEYINKYNFNVNSVYDNMDYYMFRLLDLGEKIELNQETYNDFIPTSIALIRYKNEIIANVRYVNYRIQKDGSYLMSKNNIISNNECVRTKNAYLKLTDTLNVESNLIFMNEKIDNKLSKQTNILGIEDIRLFEENNQLKFIGTSREFSTNSTNSIVVGDYNIETYTIENANIIESPFPDECEKNWIPIKNKIIYKWFPLQIGEINNNKLILCSSSTTPEIFRHLRGSSNVVEYRNEFWTVVHGVKYTTPRKYYHMIVVLDTEYKLKKYTVPFCFDTYKIEYSLGMLINNNIVYITASRNDSDPIIIKVELRQLDKLFVNLYYEDSNICNY
jgi:hypothetical protein